MPAIKRRQFLQAASSTLAAIGLSQTRFLQQANRYGQVLAQSNPRKLALLVGVNAYPNGIPSLKGCLTDVRMQYELLVHRFGFKPEDIVIVSDNSDELPTNRIWGTPNRLNILTAFEEHLIKQAKAGDIVVFHFSGHGSLVFDREAIEPFAPFNGTMMPTDARTSPSEADAQDIMGKTLFLLASALQTDNVTTILDSCFSGGGIRGGLVYRAFEPRLPVGAATPHAEELEYQERWMATLGLSKEDLRVRREAGIAKGIALGSSKAHQLSAEVKYGNGEIFFRAGAFTYMLTRYLWQQSSNQEEAIGESFARLTLSTRTVDRGKSSTPQDPIYEISPTCEANCDRKPIYFFNPTTPSAEAVVTKVDEQLEFWMGGISSRSLNTFTPGARFNLLTINGNTIGTLEQVERRGLTGIGKLIEGGPATVGMFLREQIRGVPDNPTLLIALDPSLSSQSASAQSALASVNRVQVVPINGSSEIDYIFGYMGRDAREQANKIGMTNLPPDGSLCLFTPGPVPVPDSWHKDFIRETVIEAVDRLKPRFKMLLAGHILKYVLNTDTSDVNVNVNVIPSSGRGVRSRFGSRSATETDNEEQSLSESTQTLLANSEIRIEVVNNEDRGLYIAVIVVSSAGDLNILYPLSPNAAEASALISSKDTLIVPNISEPPFAVQGPTGFLELLVIASTAPLQDALKALEQVARSRGDTQLINLEPDEAVEVVESLLRDLDHSSRGEGGYNGPNRGVDTTQLAAISAVFGVVE